MNDKYDIIVTRAEDGIKECSNYGCTLEEAKYYWDLYEGNPEYKVELQISEYPFGCDCGESWKSEEASKTCKYCNL